MVLVWGPWPGGARRRGRGVQQFAEYTVYTSTSTGWYTAYSPSSSKKVLYL